MTDLPHTPGFWGYVLAVAVSVATAPTLLFVPPALLVVATEGAGLGGLAVLWLYGAGFTAVFAVPLACVGVPVIHLLCRTVPSQRVHVAVTGLVTFVLVCAFFAVPAGFDFHGDGGVVVAFAGIAAVATMVGRGAVVPVVRSRRVRARVGRPHFGE